MAAVASSFFADEFRPLASLPSAAAAYIGGNLACVKDVSDAELDGHIVAFGQQLERCMGFGERAEAARWQQAMYAAIGERDARQGAARHAAFERRLDEGVDYFGVQGELAAQKFRRPT